MSQQPIWSLDGKSVLVVDDFREMHSMMREMCGALGSRDLRMCANGDDALEALAERAWDIVLCDYNLGAGRDGQQVLEEARDRGLIPHATVFIMVTAENIASQVMGAVEYQPDSYLAKPFTKAELRARIRKLQDKKAVFADVYEAIDRLQVGEAGRRIDALVDSRPKYAFELLRMKADLLCSVGDHAAAEAVYNQVLEQREVVWALYGLGCVRMHQQRPDAAVDLFRAAIGVRETFMPAHDALADALRVQGRTQDAQQALIDAVARSPKNTRRQQALGELSLETNDLPTAEHAYEAAVHEGRHSMYGRPDDFGGLAEVHMRRDDGEAAGKVVEQMKKTYRKAGSEARLQAALVEGRVGDRLGHAEAAAAATDAALAIYRERPEQVTGEAALQLAELCAAHDRGEVAGDLMQHAVRSNHEDPDLIRRAREVADRVGLSGQTTQLIDDQVKEMIELNNRGVRMVRSGELADSVKLFVDAARAMPNNLTIILNAAHALLLFVKVNGRKRDLLRQAAAYLRQAATVDASDSRYQTLRQMYEDLAAQESQA